MSAPRNGKPYIWASWLTSLLAGEAQCQYASWVKAHFHYTKRPDATFNLAAWNAEHTALLERRRHELEAEGWRVTLENANSFRLHGASATLGGKPDLIASKAGDWVVVDTKTGAQKNRDWWQCLIYMLAVPKAFALDAARLSAEVCYPTHRIPIAPDELTGDRADRIAALIRSIAAKPQPIPMPSASECHWCDVAECTARIDQPVTEVAVPELF